MSNVHSVSVRALAEFATERGDLMPGGSYGHMRDGVRGHQALQELLPPNWRAEAAVSRDIELDGRILRIHGRADAVFIGPELVCVQEIKTTSKNPSLILKYDHPAHWAQGEIYAALFCMNHNVGAAQVRLTYARLDGKTNEFTEDYDADTLKRLLYSYARPYLEWVSALDDWKDRSQLTLETFPFPYDDYRDGQREMARAVFLAMKRGGGALIEAPTGIGKTAAALFGALKALGKGYVTALFYLTARTTGRRSAEDALDRMRRTGLAIRSVTITAKEKCCLLTSPDCMGCPHALGYYDRRRDALKEAMATQKLDADAIHDLAVEHNLCPFELSLDLSETADVIICDYNYAFDPRVRIKRYFDAKSKAGLLVDEAHNLASRAREMLSASVSGWRLNTLRKQVIQFEGKDSPMARLMTQLLPTLKCTDDAEPEATAQLPETLIEALKRFSEAAMELQSAEPEVREFIYDTQWFVNVSKRFDEDSYRAMILPKDGFLTVRLWCCDPSKALRRAFDRVGGAALFSATLAPMRFYAAQLGVDGENDESLQLESPFPMENLAVYRLSVPVTLKDRERTRNTVAQVIHAMAEGRPGNYIACFPSYVYMTQVFRHYRMLFPYEDALCQQPNMTEAQRAAFIERFQPSPRRSMVAFIVLGGVFAEGIDLPGDRLIGAAIVSTGMPQLSFERETLRQLLDDADDGGLDAAYTYPGLRRVLQAAGRVIRTETDRGVVVLMDTRYRQPNISELLPPHWDVRDINKLSELKTQLAQFWKNDGIDN